MSKSITQKMKYKQSVIKFSFKYGVKEAAKKFNEWPKTIYRWIERYDGSIESLADELGVSPSYLSRKFKQETSYTFLDMLNKYRVQKAVELMMKEKDKYRVYEIADIVGFGDYKNFSLVFKKYTNFSPKDFIKANSVIFK